MTLPWVRLETAIPGDRAILELVAGNRWRAISCYVFGLTYCGAQEHGDGVIPRGALGLIHARPADARELVAVGLWVEHELGYAVRSWEKYQPDQRKREAVLHGLERARCAKGIKAGKPCSCGDHAAAEL